MTTHQSAPERWWTILGAVLVIAGIVLRVRAFGSNPSLWLDESSLALNILSRSFRELLKPLDYAQGAPILFLWLEKLVVEISRSSSEFALRLVPVVSGAAACAGFWALCRRFGLSAAGTVCATALFSFSPMLIDYSVQAKPYSIDVLAAIVIYLTASRFLERDSRQNSVMYGLAGLLAMAASYPSVFVLAGAGIVILIDAWRRGDRHRLALQSVIVVVWLVGFALDFFFLLRRLSQIPGMLDYWRRVYDAFMPLSPQAPAWLFRASIPAAAMTGFRARFVLPLAIIGLILLWRRDWRIPAMLCLPAVFALLASGLGRYPFAERMILFLTPSFLVCAGAGLSAPFLFTRRLQPAAVAVCGILILTSAKASAAREVGPEQPGREAFREAFLAVVQSGCCTDHILIYERAANHYRYYNRFRWSGKYTAPIVTAAQLSGDSFDDSDNFWIHFAQPSDHDVSSFDRPPCFWLVYAHTSADELARLARSLSRQGYRKMSGIERTGAGAVLILREKLPDRLE